MFKLLSNNINNLKNPFKLPIFISLKSFYSTTSTVKTNDNDVFIQGELVLASLFTKKPIKDKKKSSIRTRYPTSSRKLVLLNEKEILKTKYFDIMHKHIIDRNVNNCNFEILPCQSQSEGLYVNIKRPSLYEYVTYVPQRAVQSQYVVLAIVPFLLEIDRGKKILESGTGNGCMTMFLSQYLNDNCGGLIHTFDKQQNAQESSAEKYYKYWKTSYDKRNKENKWLENIKFFNEDIYNYQFSSEFNEFYDIVYLDLPIPKLAVKNIYKLIKINGILVVNTMQLTQILQLLNFIRDENYNLVQEIVIEPSSRLWNIRHLQNTRNNTSDSTTNELNDPFSFVCRVENEDDNKFKRYGLFSPHWPGFLVKFRKVS